MFVIPAPGLKIKCPILFDVLPPEGREVEPSEYWMRAVRDGDVTIGGEPMKDAPAVALPPPGNEPATVGYTDGSHE